MNPENSLNVIAALRRQVNEQRRLVGALEANARRRDEELQLAWSEISRLREEMKKPRLLATGRALVRN